jgi:DNA-binding GntR family transcriptional regulator
MANLGELERTNLADGIASLLRQSIMTGELPPGTRLIELELSRQLGVSRGPLREAMRILETEGLLENSPGRGTSVTEFSEKDIHEVYTLRSVLEQEAIRRAALLTNDENLTKLQETLDALFNAALEGNPTKVTELDFQFHTQIWKIADHQLLMQVLQGLATQIRMFLAVQTHLYNDLAEGISDHEKLLQVLKEKDGEGGVKIIKDHLQVAEDVILTHLSQSAQSG